MVLAYSTKWWQMIVRGMAALLFGILAFAWPGLTLFTLVLLFGVYALIDGFVAILAAMAGGEVAGGGRVPGGRPWWEMLLVGLLGILVALITFFWPGVTAFTLVVVVGEFGRTPRINNNAGRDHWPQVSCAFLAGGGMRTGQAIGSTNRLGEYAKDRPVHVQEIVATIYKNLGIDVNAVTLRDPTGRPQYLVDHRTPMPELV